MMLAPARILVTSSSFLDTPGDHRALIDASRFEVIEARGPLDVRQLLQAIKDRGPFDGILCGEDEVSAAVIQALSPRCRVLSKYGVGLDKIDQDAAKNCGMMVCNTPGVSTTAVAELVFGLIISLARDIPEHNRLVHSAVWQRRVGIELHGKTIGIVGLGQVGRAVCQRALAFGMNVLAYNSSWSSDLSDFEARTRGAISHGTYGAEPTTFQRTKDLDALLRAADIISLHVNLNRDTKNLIDGRRLRLLKRSALLINVSRGGLVDHAALADALRNGNLSGYGADVLEVEPVNVDEPLLNIPHVILTPHIGSRTRTSIQRQGIAAWKNLVEAIERNSEGDRGVNAS